MKDTYDARERNLGIEGDAAPRLWRRRLLLIVLATVVLTALVVGFAVWWKITHVSSVRAVVCAEVVNLACEVDARLEELLVKPGQRVSKGEVLARLDDSALRAALAVSEEEREIRSSLTAQSRANVALVEASVEADISLARMREEIAAARVANAEAATAMRRAKVPAEIQQAQAECDEAGAKLRQLQKGFRKEIIEEAQAKLATAQARVSLAEMQRKMSEELVKKGLESPLMLQIKETDLVARRNEASEATLRLAVLEAGATEDEIEAAKQTLAARDAGLTLAKSNAGEIEVLATDLSARQAEFREARAELKHAESRKVQIEIAREHVHVAEAEMRKAEAVVAGQRAALRCMTIVSPVEGTVIRTFESEGEVCRRAVPLVLVTNDSGGCWIEAFVAEDDAAKVRLDQQARVELVVGSGNTIDATVSAVALSTAAIGRNGTDGAERFLGEEAPGMVWVKLRPLKPMTNVIAGMSARVRIRVY